MEYDPYTIEFNAIGTTEQKSGRAAKIPTGEGCGEGAAVDERAEQWWSRIYSY
jgi:hypothetical protein